VPIRSARSPDRDGEDLRGRFAPPDHRTRVGDELEPEAPLRAVGAARLARAGFPDSAAAAASARSSQELALNFIAQHVLGLPSRR
jgi:hypothetical protein